MNRKVLSASLGAMLIGIQMGSPAFADVTPDEQLLHDLLLLDCYLLDDDHAGMARLLDENDDLLRLIKGRLPDCTPEALEQRRVELADFGDRRNNSFGPDNDDNDEGTRLASNDNDDIDTSTGSGAGQY